MNNSKRISSLIIWMLIGPILFSQTMPSSDKIEKTVNEYLAPLIKNDLFNGSILIMKDGKSYVNKGYGFANVEHKVANTPNTRFRIASISKAFTKLAILQLSEKGSLDVNDKLSKFIVDYPNGDKITINNLLNHSSGIPHLNDFPNYDQFAKENYSLEGVIEIFKSKPLDFEPGTKESYSNSGFAILVYIIEKVSSLEYGDYLNTFIFEPAKMENSGHDSGMVIIENLARGYTMNLNGKGLQLPLYYDCSIKIGGGSLYSTTRDLYLFNKAYQEGILSQSTKPLYDQGIFGRSPGYNASIWSLDDIFISVLSNNYSAPIQKIAMDLSNIMLGKEYAVLDIDEFNLIPSGEMKKYEGDYKIGDDIETIEFNKVLIEYENGDKLRGCRLIPLSKDTFFDTCYFEKLTFIRDIKTGKVVGFKWESGDETDRITKHD